MLEGFNVSFENIHKILSKCTPDQIMLYQIAINLHRVLNLEKPLTFEQGKVMEQIICSRRQLKFQVIQ